MTDNGADEQQYRRVFETFADHANATIKEGVPFQVVLSALANITLHIAIKLEKSGDSTAALKRLQDYLAQTFADMAEHTRSAIRQDNRIQ